MARERAESTAATAQLDLQATYNEIGKLLSDPQRRLAYDALRVTNVHDTRQDP